MAAATWTAGCRQIPDAAALLKAGGYTCVLWNAIPRDWADPEGWVGTALAQLALHYWTLMVLHDGRRDAMRHLDRFLAEVKGRGGRLRQDFPASCLPLACGRITGPLAVWSARRRNGRRTAPPRLDRMSLEAAENAPGENCD